MKTNSIRFSTLKKYLSKSLHKKWERKDFLNIILSKSFQIIMNNENVKSSNDLLKDIICTIEKLDISTSIAIAKDVFKNNTIRTGFSGKEWKVYYEGALLC